MTRSSAQSGLYQRWRQAGLRHGVSWALALALLLASLPGEHYFHIHQASEACESCLLLSTPLGDLIEFKPLSTAIAATVSYRTLTNQLCGVRTHYVAHLRGPPVLIS